jgi:hypothetical protein
MTAFQLKLREERPATIEERRELINRIAMLEAVIANTIESIERGSTSAPVLECLKAAIAHRSAEVDHLAIQTLAIAFSKFAPDLMEELVRRWKARPDRES